MNSLSPPIYLDHHASAPLCAAARQAIQVHLNAGPGNPSSIHGAGQAARHALDHARSQVATAVGVAPRQVIFTSGATEANHTALRGVCAASSNGGTIWRSEVEHPSVATAASQAERTNGDPQQPAAWSNRLLVVTRDGRVDLQAAADAFATEAPDVPTTQLISLCLVSNELGTIQPVAALASLARNAFNAPLIHCDASQALGRLSVDFPALQVDFLTLSGHKIGAPAGIGALIVRDGIRFDLLLPGHQEEGRRAGTENLLGAVAFGAACADLSERRDALPQIRHLRDSLWAGIATLPWPAHRHVDVQPQYETGTCLSVAFPGCAGSDLVMALDVEGVAISAGSACSSGTLTASAVIEAIVGPDRQPLAEATVRFSLGPETTAQDIAGALERIEIVLARLHEAAT